MKELRDPLTLAIYGLEPETKLVRVTMGNRSGLYTAEGRWCSGDRLDVCPHMCVWVGGPNPVTGASANYRQM